MAPPQKHYPRGRLRRDCLKAWNVRLDASFRSEGPAENRPGREAGIRLQRDMSSEGATLPVVPHLRSSFIFPSFFPALRPGLISAGASRLCAFNSELPCVFRRSLQTRPAVDPPSSDGFGEPSSRSHWRLRIMIRKRAAKNDTKLFPSHLKRRMCWFSSRRAFLTNLI